MNWDVVGASKRRPTRSNARASALALKSSTCNCPDGTRNVRQTTIAIKGVEPPKTNVQCCCSKSTIQNLLCELGLVDTCIGQRLSSKSENNVQHEPVWIHTNRHCRSPRSRDHFTRRKSGKRDQWTAKMGSKKMLRDHQGGPTMAPNGDQ